MTYGSDIRMENYIATTARLLPGQNMHVVVEDGQVGSGQERPGLAYVQKVIQRVIR